MIYYFIPSLAVSALLRDILILPVGSFYLTTYKLALLAITLYSIYNYRIYTTRQHGFRKNITNSFILFLILLSVSVILSHDIGINEKVNHFLFNIIIVYILILWRSNIRYIDLEKVYKYATKVFILIFFLELIIGAAQLIFREQIIPSIGIISSNMPYYIFGLNYERLFLAEFLTIGYAIIILEDRYSFFTRTLLGITVFTIVLISGSFTGLLGLILTVVYSRRLAGNMLSKISTAIIIALVIFRPAIEETFLSASALRYQTARTDHYFNDSYEYNWRLYSGSQIINAVKKSPSVLGAGFRASNYMLQPSYEFYIFNKSRIKAKEDKFVSNHTILSTLYDQGILGFTIMLIFIYSAVSWIFRSYKAKPEDQFFSKYYKLTGVLLILLLLRLLLYYHSLIHWHFIVALMLGSATPSDRNKHENSNIQS